MFRISTLLRRVVSPAWSRLPNTTTCLQYSSSVKLYSYWTKGAISRQGSVLGIDNYEHARKNYKLEVPEKYNFPRDVIDKWAELSKTDPDKCNKTALWWVHENGQEIKWSFPDISEKSKKIANILEKDCGLKKGDSLLLLLGRNPEWWLIGLAAMRCGIVMIPGMMSYNPQDINQRLKLSQAKCIVTNEEMAECVEQASTDCPDLKNKMLIAEESRPGWLHYETLFNDASTEHQCQDTKSSDPAVVYFTSGTTGVPKLAEHTQGSLGFGHQLTTRFWYDAQPSDVLWGVADVAWTKAGYSSMFGSWLSGCCTFSYSAIDFNASEYLNVLCKYPVTIFCAPPTSFRLFIREEQLHLYKFMALRHVTSAGEPLNPEVELTWEQETGYKVFEGYGLTETGLIACNMRCMERRPGSFGKPLPTVEMAILDENGNEAPVGIEGDIALKVKPKSPVGLFTRYLNNPEATASAFRGDYFLPGDRGKMDKDGYFWFVGRADDVIVSGGYPIGPFEVESALVGHDAVMESAVVSTPDEKAGEAVKAFITLTPEYQNYTNLDNLKSHIQEYVKKAIDPYKCPTHIEFVPDLPKTISGKIRRVVLRQNEWRKKSKQ